jgi:hypothetical protein
MTGDFAWVQAPPPVPLFVAALLLLPQPAASAASATTATTTAVRICILYNLSPLSIDFVDYCKVPLPQ